MGCLIQFKHCYLHFKCCSHKNSIKTGYEYHDDKNKNYSVYQWSSTKEEFQKYLFAKRTLSSSLELLPKCKDRHCSLGFSLVLEYGVTCFSQIMWLEEFFT